MNTVVEEWATDKSVGRARNRRVAASVACWTVWSLVAIACGISAWHWAAAQILVEHAPLTFAAIVFNISLTLAVIVGVWGFLLDIATARIRGLPGAGAVATFPGAMLAGYGAGLLAGTIAHATVVTAWPSIVAYGVAMVGVGAVLLALPAWIAKRRETAY